MRRAWLWMLCALVVASGVAIGARPAVSEADTCTDPVDDTFLKETPADQGPGALDIVEMTHNDESGTIDYLLTTKDPYDREDVGEINWYIDADASDDAVFEGRVWIRNANNKLVGSVIHLSGATETVVATATVVHEDGSDELTVEYPQDALEELGVEDSYAYYVETTEADQTEGYRQDFTEACTHLLTAAEEAPAPTPTTTTIDLDATSIQQGGIISGSAGGFDPNSHSVATVFSDPVALGTVQANAQGVGSFSFRLPMSVTPGSHRIELRGVNPGGATHLASANFTVVAAQVALPDTGAGVARLTWTSILLLALGLALLTATLLRRRPVAVDRAPTDGAEPSDGTWPPTVRSWERDR